MLKRCILKKLMIIGLAGIAVMNMTGCSRENTSKDVQICSKDCD